MGLKHLTLANSIEAPDWTSQVANGHYSSSSPEVLAVAATSSLGTADISIRNSNDKISSVNQSLSYTKGQRSNVVELETSRLDSTGSLEDVSFEELLSLDDINSTNGSDSANDLDTDLESFLSNGLDDYFAPKKAPVSVVGAAKSQTPKTPREIIRERRKKDEHNMIERRRRYHINDRIKELATLLPKKWREEMKLNKGTILRASVDYIRLLNRNQLRIRRVIEQAKIVKTQNMNALQRIREIESLLTVNGIPIPVDNVAMETNSHNFPINPAQRMLRSSPNYEPQVKYARLSTEFDTQWPVNGKTFNGEISQNSDEPTPPFCSATRAVSVTGHHGCHGNDFTMLQKSLSPITPFGQNFDCDTEMFPAQTAFNFANIFLNN